jgi:hypothetical protein
MPCPLTQPETLSVTSCNPGRAVAMSIWVVACLIMASP